MTNKSKNIMISDDIELFELNEGSLYKNGYMLGTIYKNRIDTKIYYKLKEDLYQKIKLKHSNLIFNLIYNKIKEWINELKNNFSIAIDDIFGFSEALEIKDDTLLEINIIVEIYDYMCTLLGVISDDNRWNLRILDLDEELIEIIKKLNLPLSVIINNISDDIKYIMFGYVGFFNAHTSYINNSMVTTFSWNNLELKDFLKNKIPPMFHIKYSLLKYKNINKIHNYLESQNIIYDGYVMLMNNNEIILYYFDKEKNQTIMTKEGNSIISDYSFELSNNLEEFIRKKYKTKGYSNY